MRAILRIVRNLPFSVISPNSMEIVHSLFGQYTNSTHQSADRPSCIGASRESEEMNWVTGVIIVGQETVGFPNVLVESVSSAPFLMNFCQLHCSWRLPNMFLKRQNFCIVTQSSKWNGCMCNWDIIGAIQITHLYEEKLEEGCFLGNILLESEKNSLDRLTAN